MQPPEIAVRGTVWAPAGHDDGKAGCAAEDRPSSRPRRTVQAGLVGLLTAVLAVAAHLMSGGALPGAALLAALAALSALAAVVVLQLRVPGWTLLLLLGTAQQVLHWLLGGLGGAPTSFAGLDGHHAGGVPIGQPVNAMVNSPTDPPSGGSGHAPEDMLMVHAHAAAALLVVWAVTRYRKARARGRRRTVRVQHPWDDEGRPRAVTGTPSRCPVR